jgi:ADP-heptose:LPS heptosyltransferase
MNIRQSLERLGRRFLLTVWVHFFGAKKAPLVVSEAPRILVVRLDPRLGNLLLLTPVLQALRKRFPAGCIDVLANTKSAQVLALHPAVTAVLPYRKRALFAWDGPFLTPLRLRRRHYDVCIDMANPRDPSLTQAYLVRLSGAAHTLGSGHAAVRSFYSVPVQVAHDVEHEVDLRLALIAPLVGPSTVRRLTLGAMPLPEASPIPGYVDTLPRPFAVINLGARLRSKRLLAGDYGALADAFLQRGLAPVLTYGPAEAQLAQQTQACAPGALLAPPTGVAELACLMRAASAVVSCDTGPMHLAVATGTPTCGVFVSTSPERFGHTKAPHGVIDARGRAVSAWLPELHAWIQ